MQEQKNGGIIERMDIQIGVTIVLCLLLCHAAEQIGFQNQALAVCTGAVMCVQDSAKAAYKVSLTRILGVICGGVTGVVVVLIDNVIGIPFVFYLLCGVGVVGNLLLCKRLKMVYIQARVSCMTLLLVALALQGTDRLRYALGRFLGSLVGAVAAVLVSMAFAAITQKSKNKGKAG